MASGRMAWVYNTKDENGNPKWPTIHGMRDAEVNTHSFLHRTDHPQNQPYIYAMHPKYEEVGKPPPEKFETSADIFSLSVVEKSPRMQQSVSQAELAAKAQKQFRGALTSLGTPDSPTRRHELRRYTQVPWVHPSGYPNDRPLMDVVQPLKDAGDDPRTWVSTAREKNVDAKLAKKGNYRDGVSPSGRPLHPSTRPDLTQRKSVLVQNQKVQEDGTVIATGLGNRARELVEDVYGHVRPVWRYQANAMVPGRQTVSPFRANPRSVSPATPRGKRGPAQVTLKAGRKQPYAFAASPRTGSKGPESPRFGVVKKSPSKKGLANDASGAGIAITTIVKPNDPEADYKPKKKANENYAQKLGPQKTGYYGRAFTGHQTT